MKQGVYKLVNSVNTRVYIGQSIDIENRHKTHIRQLQSNNHHSHKLQSFYNSHKNEKGFNIECEVVEIVDRVELLDGREKYYINKYNSYLDGFNSIGF